jgi:TonB family protein
MVCRSRCLLIAMAAIGFSGIAVEMVSAQTSQQEIYVEPAELSTPKYPPLARTARVSGDVKLELQLRSDGTVSSVRVISGHPMLAPAAVESAKASRFACYGCMLPASYTLTYTFGFRHDGCNSVRVGARSPKCLYLWKCRTWYEDRLRDSIIIQSRDRITVGADSPCVEPETTAAAK